jgi:hypothetical protein
MTEMPLSALRQLLEEGLDRGPTGEKLGDELLGTVRDIMLP